ncbi:p53 and DNA damage-regulated protein 1 [Eumeta japonica]|uniref:p53 and DNA damage-regulated protein 1 n=1 Tax=Eumeta variegata TaxID=151549 RepID=A0A4C1WXQ6_EUMVA|nr:p53 and DNA damage-regulated protein 1 [Eumeta japonica]
MDDQKKTLKYLESVEKLAEEILSDKREIIMLDQRRNENREALREVSKQQQTKCWLTVGSVLVKHDIKSAKELLEADQKQLNIDINKLRSDLKIKVNELRDLEMQPPVPGFMLVPMSQKESSAFASAGLFPS